jgi:hypothetical protein
LACHGTGIVCREGSDWPAPQSSKPEVRSPAIYAFAIDPLRIDWERSYLPGPLFPPGQIKKIVAECRRWREVRQADHPAWTVQRLRIERAWRDHAHG